MTVRVVEKDLAGKAVEPKVNQDHRRDGGRIHDPALDDDLNIPQAILHNSRGKGEGDEAQRNGRNIKRNRLKTKGPWKRITQCKGQATEHSPADDPSQLPL